MIQFTQALYTKVSRIHRLTIVDMGRKKLEMGFEEQKIDFNLFLYIFGLSSHFSNANIFFLLHVLMSLFHLSSFSFFVFAFSRKIYD